MFERGVGDLHFVAVLQALTYVIQMLGMGSQMPILLSDTVPGQPGTPDDTVPSGRLAAGLLVAAGLSDSATQFNADVLIRAMADNGLGPTGPYQLVLLRSDMYASKPGMRASFVAGNTSPEFAAIMSYFRLKGLCEEAQLDCLQTLAFHEIGHLFGALEREHDVLESLGTHCANYYCVMRQFPAVPRDLEIITGYRLGRDEQGRLAYCDECANDMRRYFNR